MNTTGLCFLLIIVCVSPSDLCDNAKEVDDIIQTISSNRLQSQRIENNWITIH